MPSLYLHIPFCRRKCPYCDFFSVEGHSAFLAEYPRLLVRHLELAGSRQGWAGPLETVFFGGGTPSLLAPEAVGAILEAAARLFGLAADAEISLEANPGTVSADSLAGYRSAGVNRLSFGIQSLEESKLGLLERLHTPREAIDAVEWARQAGFDNLSCDLMFALPGQGVIALERELDHFLALDPEHLSCYGLSVEEGTPFAHRHRSGGLALPDEDLYAELFKAVHQRLSAAGYKHYEISNYARPGRTCRHNQRYWQRQDYLGVGAGAHSFCANGWGERYSVPADLALYRQELELGSDPAESLESFDRRGAMSEQLYLGLRTAAGVCEEEFRSRYGIGVAEAFPEAVTRVGKRLRFEQGRWRLDLHGWLLYDHLISEFL